MLFSAAPHGIEYNDCCRAPPGVFQKRENMETPMLEITALRESEIDALQPLVTEFVQSHPSLPFRENYWEAFRPWLEKGVADDNTNPLLARLGGNIAGFVVGDIRENAPIFTPALVGHVGVLVVAGNMRRRGVGDSLWNVLCSWFASRGVTYCELYTEFGNRVSGPFWSSRGFDTFLEKRRFIPAPPGVGSLK